MAPGGETASAEAFGFLRNNPIVQNRTFFEGASLERRSRPRPHDSGHQWINSGRDHCNRMFFRLLGKTVWFTGKMAVKYVLVPIAITAVTAVVLEKLSERLDNAPNGSTVTTTTTRSRPARVSAE